MTPRIHNESYLTFGFIKIFKIGKNLEQLGLMMSQEDLSRIFQCHSIPLPCSV